MHPARSSSPWPLLYIVVAAVGGTGGYFLGTTGPTPLPAAFVLVAGLGTLLFTFVMTHLGFERCYADCRAKPLHEGPPWRLPPSNLQGNRFGQTVFFMPAGLLAILLSRGDRWNSTGFFPLGMGLGIFAALMLLRWRARRAQRATQPDLRRQDA